MSCANSTELNGIELDAEGASALIVKFTRTDSTDSLLNAAARIKLSSGTVAVELTSGTELENRTNTATTRAFEFLITQAHKTTLLNGTDSATVTYKAFITPSGGSELLSDRDSSAVGQFTIISDSASGLGTPVPAIETIDLDEQVAGNFPTNRTENHLVKFINAATAGTAVGACGAHAGRGPDAGLRCGLLC